jgi:phosphosulfolactate synthase
MRASKSVPAFHSVPVARPEIGVKRDGGLTHVLDKGLGPRGWEDVLDTCGDYIDIVKLGWGTAYVTQGLERKLEILKGKPVVMGGTFFEVIYARDAFDEYKKWLNELGITHVEISDGTVDIPRERKLELIADFARDFTVLSEVGSKDSEVVFAPYEWVEWIKDEKAAGAWKVITEAREGGTAGIFRPSGEMRTGLVDEIAHSIDFHDLVWEAPTKASQAWFIKNFGPEVNLGNIPPEEVIPLETLRLGLRGDTLKEVLLDDREAAAAD